GVPGFEAYAWQGFVGPAHLSPALTERLNKSLATALRHPETRAKLEEIGIQPMEMTPQQFAGFVRSEQALWSGVIKAANIKMD
ncbi:MAG: ABC transporter substrate-binding protein, partial [Delftia sp.]|nr:ABC transporter substrate-binding protein [Delftia sp.]